MKSGLHQELPKLENSEYSIIFKEADPLENCCSSRKKNTQISEKTAKEREEFDVIDRKIQDFNELEKTPKDQLDLEQTVHLGRNIS